MVDATPDLLRLFALLPLAWAAWSDHHTRRVDRRVWAVLIVIGAVAAVWQVNRIAPIHTVDEYRTLTQLILVPPVTGFVAIVLHRSGAFGGADAKALFALGLVYPAPVEYVVPILSVQLPIYQTQIAIVAISFYGLLFGIVLFLLRMWYRNFSRGGRSLKSLVTCEIPVSSIPETPGQMRWSDEELNSHKLDLDALRMYLRWRGLSVADLIQQADILRDERLLETTYEVDDGVIASKITAKHPLASEDFSERGNPEVADQQVAIAEGDTWGADIFLGSINHNAYGTTSEELRRGLEHVQDKQTIRIQPAFPLIVPLFLGVAAAVTVGDIIALLAVTV